jgi:trk system potassium uptake protein TrkA
MTDPVATRQIDLESFDTAVVSIGADVEASVLVAGNLLDAGINNVWAKATTEQHARILKRIGVTNIVNPEADAGNRVGHLVSSQLIDYIQIDEDFVIAKMSAPREVQGFKLSQSQIRSKYGVTVLGTKTPGEEIESATADTKILEGDTIVVGGAPELIEEFAKRNG